MNIIKKLSTLVITLFIIVTLTFFLMKALPGDPFTDEKALPTEVLQSLQKHYNLDQPLFSQYISYLKSILVWDLGPSFTYPGRTVNDIINNGFPVSALLGLEALCIAITAGTLLGTLAAIRHRQWPDHLVLLITVAGISIPSFILAAFLQYTLSLKLGIFPVARWGSFMHTVLPALALAALPTAFIARLIRSNMLEVLKQDYIKAAKAKGLSASRVIYKHAIKNAILPVITYLGQLTTNILMGSFIIEKIFSIPGLGHWLITGVSNRDYSIIMGITVFYSVILLSIMCLVDILYGYVDPRTKEG